VPERDAATLHALTNGDAIHWANREVPAYDADALVWRFMGSGPFADVAAMQGHLGRLVETPNSLALVVRDRATDHAVGVVTFMSNAPEHLKIELGNIFYSPIVQGRGVNAEATYLMLEHAFALGYQRVEWKCNALNERSRRAALRMGFTFEGIQEAHYIIKQRVRDTAWFRLLAAEWPRVRPQLGGLFGQG
jgi:RimJ/RimL family protein N-acetyltransferase